MPTAGGRTLHFARSFETPGTLKVFVVSGSDFQALDLAYEEAAAAATGWDLVASSSVGAFDLEKWAGQNVKLRFETTGRVAIDDVGSNLSENRFADPDFPVARISDPIDVVGGSFSYSHTDLHVPGRGIPLEFTRYYNSLSTYNGALGQKWSHNYAWSLSATPLNAVVQYPQGGSINFTWNSATSRYVGPAGNEDFITIVGSDYELTTTSQVVYHFNSLGRLTFIWDRNLNVTSLYYDASGRLDRVVDPGSRQLDFIYSGSSTTIVWSWCGTVSAPFFTDVSSPVMVNLGSGQNHCFQPCKMFNQSSRTIVVCTKSECRATSGFFAPDGEWVVCNYGCQLLNALSDPDRAKCWDTEIKVAWWMLGGGAMEELAKPFGGLPGALKVGEAANDLRAIARDCF